MAAANDNQGLKIAVAAFVALTVILAVSTYFAYSAYSQADAQRTAAEEKGRQQQKVAADALGQYDELRKQIGTRATGEDPEAVKTEIKNEVKKIQDEINGIAGQVNEAITKAQANGLEGPEIQEAKDQIQQIIQLYNNEPNKTFLSSQDRLKNLLRNQAMLLAHVSNTYTQVKRTLEGTDAVNKGKLDAASKKVDESLAEVKGEQEKHVAEREDLLKKVDQYQTDIAKKDTEIAALTTQLRQSKEESDKKHGNDLKMLVEYRDRLEREGREPVLDRPDGKVTWVDYGRSELRTNITRSMGAKPQMNLAVFGAGSPGIPTDKPKGTVELIQVGDRYSIARIVKTVSPVDPIRPGDQLYSAAWSPNDPMRFALIGKIDINRDGRDDRSDLKRLIEAAGGIVDFDLPPPEAGKQTGELTARDAWYVIDERPPLVVTGTSRDNNVNLTPDYAEFIKKQTEAVREARLQGVRPMRVERLLNYLGYDYAAPIMGRAEAFNKGAMQNLLKPRQANTPAPAAAAPPATEEATPKEEMPKEEEPK